VDLSAFPARALLRWDLAARLVLSIVVPVGVEVVISGSLSGAGLTAALVAALVSFASLGPELSRPTWTAVAAIGVPVAVVLGAALRDSAVGSVLLVLVLFTAHGALMRAGLVSQMAWFPVAAGGMLAALLATPQTDASLVAVSGAMGAALAAALLWLVPRVMRAPRLAVPPAALDVDTDLLRRMLRHPSWRDWFFPLLLGGLSATLLGAASALTGGFKPYWAVLAFVSVVAPTAAATRRSAWETILSSLLGVLLAGLLLASGMSEEVTLAVIAVMSLVGAVFLLLHGMLSKMLLTPLPVVVAAASLDAAGALALQLRFVEYALGALVGVAAVVAVDGLTRRLWSERPEVQDVLVG